MKIKRCWLAVGLAVIVLVPVVALLVMIVSFGRSDKICKSVVISGISVGGLTRERAAGIIRDWSRKKADQPVVLTALDRKWTSTFAGLGARVKWEEAVEDAFGVGRRGGVITRAVYILTDHDNEKQDAKIVVDKTVLAQVLSNVAKSVNRPHKDATIKVENGKLVIGQDEWGIKLDEDKAVAFVAGSLAKGVTSIPLPVQADKPVVTARDLRSVDTLIARYTTRFNPSQRDRTHNLTLASRSVNGTALMPGQEFSYNATVGERLASRGFRDAPIFVRGRLKPDLGGGICQVSSTLYNAALMADLKIEERHPHSRTVPYVDPGRDATVAYGLRDFRFINSNSSPIAIITNMTSSTLTVDLYGSATDKKNIEVFIGGVQYTGSAGEARIVDATLPPGVVKVLDKGSAGVRVTVYKKTILPDGKTVTEVVSRDRYPAQKKVIGVGPVRTASATESALDAVSSTTD